MLHLLLGTLRHRRRQCTNERFGRTGGRAALRWKVHVRCLSRLGTPMLQTRSCFIALQIFFQLQKIFLQKHSIVHRIVLQKEFFLVAMISYLLYLTWILHVGGENCRRLGGFYSLHQRQRNRWKASEARSNTWDPFWDAAESGWARVRVDGEVSRARRGWAIRIKARSTMASCSRCF